MLKICIFYSIANDPGHGVKMHENLHYVKRVSIRSYSGPHFPRIFPHSDWIRRDTYSVRMRENADQNNSEYWQFFRCVYYTKTCSKASIYEILNAKNLMQKNLWECIFKGSRRVSFSYFLKFALDHKGGPHTF